MEERKRLLEIIAETAKEYEMVLDWNRIHYQDNIELKNIINMIQRVFELRTQ
jgi:hypothetical protein